MGKDFAFRQWKSLYRDLIHTALKIFMLLDLVSIIALLVLGIFVPVLVLFLPAIIELKKPKDGGPRLIEETASDLFRRAGIVLISDIEEELKLDSLVIRSMARIIDFLPTLEV